MRITEEKKNPDMPSTPAAFFKMQTHDRHLGGQHWKGGNLLMALEEEKKEPMH